MLDNPHYHPEEPMLSGVIMRKEGEYIVPEIIGNNKSWKRGGHMNQKRHFIMTDDEKSNIARCRGRKDDHPCKNPIFKCTECWNYGCDQEYTDKCSEQGFKNNKCLNCGVTGSRVPVMANEFDKLDYGLKKEVPVIR